MITPGGNEDGRLTISLVHRNRFGRDLVQFVLKLMLSCLAPKNDDFLEIPREIFYVKGRALTGNI